MKYMLLAFLLLAGLSANSQTILTIEGKTYTNSDDTWYGVIIPRSAPSTFTFRNNSITSVNRYGYLIEAGDEVPGANNNNLDGAVITGNMLKWNGTPTVGIIPHGIFTGHNINVKVKYNYLNKVPMAIIRKSNGMTDVSGAVAYNIIKDPGVGVVVKGMNGVRIFNNTFYNSLTTAQTNRALIDIYENPSVTPPGSATGTKIYNNIFYTKSAIKNISVSAACLTGLECDYNIYYCEAGTPVFAVDGAQKTFAQWQALGYDQHSVLVNPNFKDFVSFVPSTRLDYGKDLGSEWKDGLSVNAKWGTTDPETTAQNGQWQVGAVVYAAVVVTPAPIPLYTASTINNGTPDILEMTYNLTLANIIPAASAFSVKVNSVTRTVNSVAVSGTKVLLTLASQVIYGDVITVAYTKPSTNPLQTAAGGQAASVTAQNVTNNVAAATPIYVSSVIENAAPSILEMTYNLTLGNTIPAASAFTVKVNSVTRTVNSVAISGTKVLLTLASQVIYGDVINVAYTKPSTNPLQTAVGGQTASITAQNVTNNVAAATPVYVSSVIENAAPSILEMTYNLTLANPIPAASAFTVKVNTATRTVNSVAVSGTKVLLTLGSQVIYGDVITVAYTKPSTNPLQTAAGGQAASITAHNVTNNVAAATPIYVSSVIENAAPSILEMTYNLTLGNTIPAPSAFSVSVNTVARTVSSVAISGTKVLLTLASPVVYGDVVSIAYTKPATNPLQTSAGGQAVSLTAQSVTNNCAQPANRPPAVSISSPTKSNAFKSPAAITIDAVASDPDGTISKVEFYNGTTKLGERTATPYSFTWKEVAEGTYAITAVATDNSNSKTVSAAVNVVVEKAAPAINQLPSVAISSHNDCDTIEAPAKITLTAQASDSDGSIVKVEYFNNQEKIGESFTHPWTFSFECQEAGIYEIIAKASDNLNATSASAPVKISVILRREYPDLINLYPNPNNGHFTVDMNTIAEFDEKTTLAIINLSGKTIYSDNVSPGEPSRQIDITDSLSGNYILIITSRDGILTTRKFIKN